MRMRFTARRRLGTAVTALVLAVLPTAPPGGGGALRRGGLRAGGGADTGGGPGERGR